jgi:hypothetical protein
MTAANLVLPDQFKHLHAHLLANGLLRDLKEFDPDVLRVRSKDVLDKIAARESAWERLVPPAVVEVIKRKQLFGYS